MLSGVQPTHVKGQEIVFDLRGQHAFSGGNTYRFLDLKGVKFAAQGIDGITERRDGWHFHLDPVTKRTYKRLQPGGDIDGQFVISNDRMDDHTGSDYVHVHFRLEASELYRRDVYLVGGWTHHGLDDRYKLEWDVEAQAYLGEFLLKQGYYNYVLATMPMDGAPGAAEARPDLVELEGERAGANQHYTVIAYYWDRLDYDRVVAVGFGLSQP